jgi:glutathione S-transferase
MAEGKLKLVYFPTHGRAQAIRLAALIGNIELEDLFTSYATWAEDKKLYGPVPVLVLEDGSHLPQSNAILSFIGRKAGLVPEDNLQAARVEVVLNTAEDIYHLLTTAFREKDAAKKAELTDELKNGAALEVLTRVNAFLGDHTYFAGDKLSVADLKFFGIAEFLSGGKFGTFDAAWFAQFANLQRNFEAVGAVEAVKAHLANPGFEQTH